MYRIVGRIAAVALFIGLWAPGCDDEPAETTDATELDVAIIDAGLIDMAPEVDSTPGDVGMADMAPVDPDMGEEGPPCDERSNLGFEDFPTNHFDGLGFAPRVVFTGVEYGLVWQSPGDNGRNTVWFGRFDRDGNPIGDPTDVGVAAVSQHAIAFDGTNYIVAWLAVRTEQSVFDGIRIKAINADGTPSAAPAIEIAGSFDTEQLGFAWAQFGGGMLVYNRGRGGSNGIYANAISPAFDVGPQIRLTESPALSPAVVFGDGAWGAAWLAQDGEEPGELAFVLLSDDAQVLAPEERVQGGGIGNVRIAFGQGIYGVGWTKLFGAGLPQAALTLVDGGGDPFATPPLAGPEGVATVTEVAFLAPDRFVIGWQENRPSGTRVGVSRITGQGLMAEPTALDPPEGSARLGMTLGGTATRIGVWFVEDPTPGPVGFSDEARITNGNLAPCD